MVIKETRNFVEWAVAQTTVGAALRGRPLVKSAPLMKRAATEGRPYSCFQASALLLDDSWSAAPHPLPPAPRGPRTPESQSNVTANCWPGS